MEEGTVNLPSRNVFQFDIRYNHDIQCNMPWGSIASLMDFARPPLGEPLISVDLVHSPAKLMSAATHGEEGFCLEWLDSSAAARFTIYVTDSRVRISPRSARDECLARDRLKRYCPIIIRGVVME
ncbi:hypothetical protein AVEN_1444-1 [Araneus ventricosus]|uniref:Uncharacterized protein n=1 Tax=Araneus ventricosus TaxID=182803 RepID=A0A4Y2IQN6_ARAVE|nr:hypothetical protein AVEN_1444-1 [Araneus ventricosus]